MVDLIQTILDSAVEMLIKFKDKKLIFPSKVKRYTIPLHSSSCNLLTKGYSLLPSPSEFSKNSNSFHGVWDDVYAIYLMV